MSVNVDTARSAIELLEACERKLASIGGYDMAHRVQNVRNSLLECSVRSVAAGNPSPDANYEARMSDKKGGSDADD